MTAAQLKLDLRPKIATAEALCALGVDIAHGRYDAIRDVVTMLGGEWDPNPPGPPIARMPTMVCGMPEPRWDTACMVQVGFIVFGGPWWYAIPEFKEAWRLFNEGWGRAPRPEKKRAEPKP